MKVVQINTVCGSGSTGIICKSISEVLNRENIENYILYSIGKPEYAVAFKCSGEKYIKIQAIKSRLLGNYGFNSIKATKQIIQKLEEMQPDIIHIHNIHSHDCNLNMLFEYLKKEKKKVIWTFHDCWAFTGYCVHFTNVGCDKWKSNCEKCTQYKEYSYIFDKSKKLYTRKKKIFSNLDLSIVTPSQWLANIVKESFLKEHTIYVVNNGIDLNTFRPRLRKIHSIYNIPKNKKIILGVANEWSIKKGLDVFIKLASQISEEKYQIILVGTNDVIDDQLPKNIISIHRTHNQSELAEIYSAADIFVNPTREDNFPTVNIEALACGTPVITFKTGGSPEILDDTCGRVVECDDIEALIIEIEDACNQKCYSAEACRKRARRYDKDEKFSEYIKIYKELMNE